MQYGPNMVGPTQEIQPHSEMGGDCNLQRAPDVLL